jgi:hypothetical protein
MVLGLKKSVNLLQKNRLDGVFILTDGSILATDKIQNRLERKG